uniref:Dicer-2 n=1 Tax=Penaeus japonicus TaxID=27405 RepID=H6WZT1_PENJP|nr:dicer-2 [Penaeus japonicus]
MDASKEEASADFCPRSYQLELFNCALKKNSILVLGTGSGKTFISILLIKELGHQIRESLKGGSKRTVFVVNTVPLVHQQAAAIQQHTPFEVGKYEGSMGVDYWTDEHWQNELEKHEVLVVVAQIFLDLILHAKLPLSSVNLLIMDECHHATGSHPMREIMRAYENLKQHSPEKLPRIMGLTACVVHRKCKRREVLKYMESLEAAMDCALVTSVDPETVLKYTTGPKEKVICFYTESITSDYQETVKAQLAGLECDIITDCFINYKARKQIKKKVKNIEHIMSDLGDWCVARAIKYEIEHLDETEGMEEDPKIREILKLLSEKLREVYVACELKEKGMANPVEHITFKVKSLLEIFSKCNKEVFGLIFVESRNTAKILYDLLLEIAKQNPEFSFVKPSYVVGCNSRPGIDIRLAELELRKQRETLENFRRGETNFLISTSVLEEGVDIRKCNVVVRFDMPQNYRAYVQSRGRARAKPSVYLLMVEEAKVSEMLECIGVYKEIEDSLQYLCHGRNLPTAQTTRKHFAEDEYIKPYEPYGPVGPKITSNSAIQLVNLYCGKFPSDKFTDNLPEVVEEVKEGMTTVGIRLPIMAPLKDMIYGSGWANKDLAKKSAALQLCIKLHEMGELDSNLRPKESNDDSLVEGLVDLPPEEPVPEGTSESGTRKRRRVHAKDLCYPFSNEHGGSYCLYSIDIKPFGQSGESVTIDSSTCISKIGFICKEGLVSSPFPLFFSKWGDVMVNVREVGPLTDLDTSLFDKIKKFHRLVFENIIELNENLMSFDPEKSKWDVFIVPLDFSEIIDLNMLNEIYSFDSIKPVMIKSHNQNTKFVRSKFEDALIYPQYGIPSNQMYYVSHIFDELNPCNTFPEGLKGYESYERYFLERYGLELKDKNQPLLEAKHIPKELNYLKKIPKKAREKKGNLVPRFVPEFCGLIPIKASLWWQIMCMPSIFHRLNSFNLMHEFIVKTKITSPAIKNEVLDFSWTKKFIYELLGSSENTVPRFLDRKKQEYIHPFSMLHAFTLKEASEDKEFNLERLELLGDSFLKFVTGEALFLRDESYHEGRLSQSRGKRVCNKTLFRLACQKGLEGKIAAKVLNPKKNGSIPGFRIKPEFEESLRSLEVPHDFWHQVPNTVKDVGDLKEAVFALMSDDASKDEKAEKKGSCYNPWTEHEVSDKSIADCVEAIIGAYLRVCGNEAAAAFLHWLGVGVFRDNSLLMEPKTVRTARVRKECAQDLTIFYKKAVLDRLEKKIGYTFRDRSFIVQAVTHSSYVNNQVTDCYQRLEFLGDAVLDYLVTCHIFCRFTDYSPGQLSDLRSYFVKNDTLGRAAAKGKLHQHLLHINPKLEASIDKFLSILHQDPLGEELNTEDDVQDCEDVEIPKALGDMVEAIIGAVYLDSNRSLKVAWQVIERILEDLLNTSIQTIQLNPIRQLLEEVPGEKQVEFVKGEDDGSEKSTYVVKVKGFGTFTASGKNYRVAKKKVAAIALKEIHNQQAAISQLPQLPNPPSSF